MHRHSSRPVSGESFVAFPQSIDHGALKFRDTPVLRFGALLALTILLMGRSAKAQAPGLTWTANLGAQVFAVDGHTNVYANAGGKVFVLDGNGVPLRTNAICPLPGLARRDNAGNYYFGGTFDGTQNFGGVTLVGGWTNHNGQYASGYPTCFLAKYDPNGSLQWVTNFGAQAVVNYFTDLLLDPSGGFYAARSASLYDAEVVHLSNTGGRDWAWTLPNGSMSPWERVSKLGGVTTSNCCVHVISANPFLELYRLDRSGVATTLGNGRLLWRTMWATNINPLTDDAGNAFQVGRCYDVNTGPCDSQWLRKCVTGADVYDREINTNAEWTLARGLEGSVYLGGADGLLARHSDSGDLIWTESFAQPTVAMIVDSAGNRFVSFADGSVARLGAETLPTTSFGIGLGGSSAQLSLAGKLQQAWQIQVSSNLKTWTVLGVVTNISSALQFGDPASRTQPALFFRAVPLE